jgi:hypothetical protein
MYGSLTSKYPASSSCTDLPSPSTSCRPLIPRCLGSSSLGDLGAPLSSPGGFGGPGKSSACSSGLVHSWSFFSRANLCLRIRNHNRPARIARATTPPMIGPAIHAWLVLLLLLTPESASAGGELVPRRGMEGRIVEGVPYPYRYRSLCRFLGMMLKSRWTGGTRVWCRLLW